MSIWAVNWALHAEVPNATHKLVLIALANFADDQDQAWPHVDTLTELASTSRRTVFRALEALEADGLISRSMGLASGAYGGGQRQVNSLFRMHLPNTVSRRHVRGSARPDQLREIPSEIRCATGGTPDLHAGEWPNGIRCDTGGTPDLHAGERPSGIRCDVDVTPEIRCDTGDTSGVTPVSPLYTEEPSGLTTNPTPLPPSPSSTGRAGSVGSEDEPNEQPSVASRADGGPVGTAPEAWELVRSCLPEEMQALDGPSVERVVVLIRERLAAGWTPRMIHSILVGNSLPPNVRSLGGLVLHRICQIPVGGAPKRPAAPRATLIEEPVEPPEFWAQWLVERTRARLVGDPDAEQNRMWWIRRFPGPSTVPGRVDLEAHLRQELASTQACAVAP